MFDVRPFLVIDEQDVHKVDAAIPDGVMFSNPYILFRYIADDIVDDYRYSILKKLRHAGISVDTSSDSPDIDIINDTIMYALISRVWQWRTRDIKLTAV